MVKYLTLVLKFRWLGKMENLGWIMNTNLSTVCLPVHLACGICLRFKQSIQKEFLQNKLYDIWKTRVAMIKIIKNKFYF